MLKIIPVSSLYSNKPYNLSMILSLQLHQTNRLHHHMKLLWEDHKRSRQRVVMITRLESLCMPHDIHITTFPLLGIRVTPLLRASILPSVNMCLEAWGCISEVSTLHQRTKWACIHYVIFVYPFFLCLSQPHRYMNINWFTMILMHILFCMNWNSLLEYSTTNFEWALVTFYRKWSTFMG